LGKLQHCLDTLSLEQKQIVELFYLQNKCYKDIETMTGLEWNKVRSHIQNGRRNLRICMEKHHPIPDESPKPGKPINIKSEP
jgi:DNA-directed RNA polymerase specialized sigma24 family protein